MSILSLFKIRFWHLRTGELIHTLSGHTKEVTAVAVTSKGDKAISGSYDCTIKVWNTDINSRCIFLKCFVENYECCYAILCIL